MFRLNYTVMQGGHKKLDERERKMEDDTYCREGLTLTIGDGNEYQTVRPMGQVFFCKNLFVA